MRYDMMSPRPRRDGKTQWVKIGAAFQSEKGTQLVFDALPLPDAEGRCIVNLYEPRERSDNGGGGRGNSAPQRGAFDSDLDDSVPFARNDTVF